ncbi:DUF6503 family protein [Jejudonia soesokkakensis]|uniref:DUF6503 family protein n=1 Tax=Jejudonia soesokkakensis TaxID=1323432 RepID=A0ABW2MRV6_9FLAO
MKKFLLIVLVAFFISCKDETKETVVESTVIENTEETPSSIQYPKHIASVFEAHGGFENWNSMNNLCYEIEGRGDKETHTISLKDRKSKIETKKWSIGYDGNEVWLLENEPESYKGNARFYHNLMFYFYAMPFVLGDEGIVYSEMEPTELDGKMYTATKIGYNNGIGDSPEDEYILFSDPETNTMEWLGYTVTYTKGEKSSDWHFIKYDDWSNVNGLVLPKKLTWYNVKDNKPTDERNDLVFKNRTVSATVLENGVFEKPEKAIIVEK